MPKRSARAVLRETKITMRRIKQSLDVVMQLMELQGYIDDGEPLRAMLVSGRGGVGGQGGWALQVGGGWVWRGHIDDEWPVQIIPVSGRINLHGS